MSVQRMFPFVLAGLLALTLAGCSKANQGTQASYDNQRTGTAMVRGSDTGMNMDMSGNMADHMKQCQGMMKQHLGNADAQYDERFIDMMIPHHQGAINMAKDAQQKAQHPEIKKLAQKIIDAQQKEISQLKAWRKEWYGSQEAASQ